MQLYKRPTYESIFKCAPFASSSTGPQNWSLNCSTLMLPALSLASWRLVVTEMSRGRLDDNLEQESVENAICTGKFALRIEKSSNISSIASQFYFLGIN